MACFTFDDGIATTVCSTICALRMRVSMSAIGSVILISSPSRAVSYQLALTMPGTSPRIAISRSLLRARPNLRK